MSLEGVAAAKVSVAVSRIEQGSLRIESHYAAQIRRHFEDRNRGPTIEPEAGPYNEELPF